MGLKNKPENVVGYETTFNKKECGAYTLTDTATGKVYVGSTVDLHRRKIQHFSGLCNNRHFNKELQAAFNGPGTLELDFIPVDNNLPKEEAINCARELERNLIEKNREKGTLMNRSLDPNCPGKGVSPNAETREKIKTAMIGRFVSEDTRTKRSETMLGVKHSEERRNNISTARTKNSVTVDGIVYKNTTAAAKALGLKTKSVVRGRCLSPNFPNFNFTDNEAYQLGTAPHRL